MTTTLERLDKATYQHSHLEDLRAAHTEAREKWQAVAAESAKQMHAFADWLHTATLEDLIDEFAGDQTRDWHLFAEPRAIQPTAVIPAYEWLDRGPAADSTLPGREVRGDGLPELARAFVGLRDTQEIPAIEARQGWTPDKPIPAQPEPTRRQRWRARWRSEWAEFKKEVAEDLKDAWRSIRLDEWR